MTTTLTRRLASGTHPQAAFFDALARHLRQHPHLPPVNVNRDLLQVQSGHDGITALTAWGRTLTAVEGVVIRIHEDQRDAHAYLVGVLDGHRIEVLVHLTTEQARRWVQDGNTWQGYLDDLTR